MLLNLKSNSMYICKEYYYYFPLLNQQLCTPCISTLMSDMLVPLKYRYYTIS